MDSRKKLIYVIIICIISVSLVSIYLIYSAKSGIPPINSAKTTRISIEASPKIVMGDLNDLSIKGLLTTDDAVMPKENLQIILEQIRLDENQTIEKHLVAGNRTTDQNGCFYFNDWNNGLIEKMLKEIPQSDTNIFLSFRTIFNGTDDLLSSSNITEIQYSPIVVPVIRTPINLILANNTSLLQDIVLKRGESYDFSLLVSKGGMLSNQDEKVLKLDVKGFPCGVAFTIDNNVANLTAQDQVTTHMQISVDKQTEPGEYYYFIIGNNRTLKEAKLIIE